MNETTTEAPQETEPQPDEQPAFSLFFAGIPPEELGDPIGVQELLSRLGGFEQHVNHQLAELQRQVAELTQDTTARFSAMRSGVNRAVGVDPLA